MRRILILGMCLLASCAMRGMKPPVPADDEVRAAMRGVFDWQIAHPVAVNDQPVNAWARSVMYAGAMRAYEATKDTVYLNRTMQWAIASAWKIGPNQRYADDQCCAQAYLDLYELKKDPAMIADTKRVLDLMVASPRQGRREWNWCDALFMAPPVFAHLGAVTGDRRYIDLLNAMWWDTTDFLFDKEEGLYYRDANFLKAVGPHGRKVFWSRGNGWVMGGVIGVLRSLPKSDPRYGDYVTLFRTMAASVKRAQGADGLWKPSLLDPEEAPVPETSGSGFFCYAFAWGINQGILDRAEYLPAALAAWKGLAGAIQPDGRLGWVQRIGLKPDAVGPFDNQEYGVGAFLLAGTEMMRLR
jgi:unsaturated rhamnogalacturonyl hydrolase